jgi:hypothetical protein
MANAVADYCKRVCAGPAPRAGPAAAAAAQARSQVLAAVRQYSKRCTPEQAAALGSATVSAAEVAHALKHTPSGRSPGPDGLPAELYRVFRAQLAPVLAVLYSAIGALGRTPRGFLTGAITALYKKGCRLDPANYRPITLLDTDYRILGKVLSNRLGPVLDSVLGPEQTAFIPGRRIDDNILLLQLLPHYLRLRQQHAVVAFLDFHKAYDTVDRGFLASVMEAVGVGPAFLAWFRTLSAVTTAFAVVNGACSRLVRILSGVRQGAPHAPQLYLFVALAELCWLLACGYGRYGHRGPPGCRAVRGRRGGHPAQPC